MTWIRTIAPDEADGVLGRLYDAALKRAGRVFHIVRTMSLSPPVLESSFQLYQRIMLVRGGLPRRQREMLAVVVSATNDCHY